MLICVLLVTGKDLDSQSPAVQSLANWAVKELQSLSDSGIYSTLELREVLQAEESDQSIFHQNTILSLALSCPHYKSGKEVERFVVIVMKHQHEPFATIAIDEFPEMKEEAVEAFYIQKVEAKRQRREATLAKMEAEVAASANI